MSVYQLGMKTRVESWIYQTALDNGQIRDPRFKIRASRSELRQPRFEFRHSGFEICVILWICVIRNSRSKIRGPIGYSRFGIRHSRFEFWGLWSEIRYPRSADSENMWKYSMIVSMCCLKNIRKEVHTQHSFSFPIPFPSSSFFFYFQSTAFHCVPTALVYSIVFYSTSFNSSSFHFTLLFHHFSSVHYSSVTSFHFMSYNPTYWLVPHNTAQGGGWSFKDRKPIGRVGLLNRTDSRASCWRSDRWLECRPLESAHCSLDAQLLDLRTDGLDFLSIRSCRSDRSIYLSL